MEPFQIKDKESKLLQEECILPDSDTSTALQELIDLQKALLNDSIEDMEESSVASSYTFDHVQSDDSFFSSYRELLTENNVYTGTGDLWSINDPSSGMVQREAAIELTRLLEIQKKMAAASRKQSTLEPMITDEADMNDHETPSKEILLNKYLMSRKSSKEKFASLPPRLATKKLTELSRFIEMNTNRKLMVAWSFLEHQFAQYDSKQTLKPAESSMHARTGSLDTSSPLSVGAAAGFALKNLELGDDKNGGRGVIGGVKISALTEYLCSSDARLSHTELWDLYKKLKLDDSDTENSLKLAAFHVCLGINNGRHLIYETALQTGYQELLNSKVEKIVTLEEIKLVVFHPDPKEAAIEMLAMAGDRANCLALFKDEKSRSLAVEEKLEQKSIKASLEFEEVFKCIQVPRGPFTDLKHLSLTQVVAYCKSSCEAYHKKIDVVLLPEIIDFLGINSFPLYIRDQLKEITDSGFDSKSTSRTRKSFSIQPLVRKNSVKSASRSNSFNMHRSPSKRNLSFALKRADSIFEGLEVVKDVPLISGFNEAYPNGYRIALEGSGLAGSGGGTVIQMLRETVTFGKGLIGVGFRDVVQYLQAYSAVRLQAFYRGHKR